MIFKATHYFQLWFLYKSDLRISTGGKARKAKKARKARKARKANRNDQIEKARKTISSTLLIRKLFQGYRCESGID